MGIRSVLTVSLGHQPFCAMTTTKTVCVCVSIARWPYRSGTVDVNQLQDINLALLKEKHTQPPSPLPL